MRIYYDTEFIADGHSVDLVSLGMVREDGREMYAVSREFNVNKLLADSWLRDNVWPSLPRRKEHGSGGCRCTHGRYGHLDTGHPDVRSREQIRRMVEDFVTSTPEAELWSWYSHYDHVALTQLWGKMVDLPRAVPMLTLDLQQEAQRLGSPELPEQHSGHHNALSDAHYHRAIGDFLLGLAA